MIKNKISTFEERLNALLNGDFKERVDAFKDKKKISQEDFGNVTGAGSRQVISKWAKGVNKSPSLEGIEKIAETYNISIEWLLGYDVLPYTEEPNENYEYEILSKFGFNNNFYYTLKEIQNQRESEYEKYIEAINLLVEDSRYAYVDTDEGEDKFLHLPILDSIYDYLILISTNSYFINDDTLKEFQELLISKNGKVERNELEILMDTIKSNGYNTKAIDQARLYEIINSLKLYKEKLETMSIGTQGN